MSMKLSPQDLKRNFEEYDYDKNGSISINDLRNHLLSRGRALDETTIKFLFDKMDLNKNGLVDFNEFCIYMNGDSMTTPGTPKLTHAPVSYPQGTTRIIDPPRTVSRSPIRTQGTTSAQNLRPVTPPPSGMKPSPSITSPLQVNNGKTVHPNNLKPINIVTTETRHHATTGNNLSPFYSPPSTTVQFNYQHGHNATPGQNVHPKPYNTEVIRNITPQRVERGQENAFPARHITAQTPTTPTGHVSKPNTVTQQVHNQVPHDDLKTAKISPVYGQVISKPQPGSNSIKESTVIGQFKNYDGDSPTRESPASNGDPSPKTFNLKTAA